MLDREQRHENSGDHNWHVANRLGVGAAGVAAAASNHAAATTPTSDDGQDSNPGYQSSIQVPDQGERSNAEEAKALAEATKEQLGRIRETIDAGRKAELEAQQKAKAPEWADKLREALDSLKAKTGKE